MIHLKNQTYRKIRIIRILIVICIISAGVFEYLSSRSVTEYMSGRAVAFISISFLLFIINLVLCAVEYHLKNK